jgi:hypothetical protein
MCGRTNNATNMTVEELGAGYRAARRKGWLFHLSLTSRRTIRMERLSLDHCFVQAKIVTTDDFLTTMIQSGGEVSTSYCLRE